MRIKIVKNKYLNAFLLLMLFSAIVHMIVLFCWFLASKDIYVFNYLNILNLNYFYPDLSGNIWWYVLSVVSVILTYLIILFINKND